MELVTAARKHLLGFESVTILVTEKRIWKWKPEEALEGTGKNAIVLRNGGQWTKPGMNSQEYPVLEVQFWSDHSRTPDGDQIKDDRDDRVMQMYRETDRVLHQVSREVRFWPEGDTEGLLVLGCFRGSEPVGPVEKLGVAVLSVTYDVQVIH